MYMEEKPTTETKPDWFLKHEESDRREFAAIRAMLHTSEELEEIIINAQRKYFEQKGSVAKNWLVGTAVVVAALTVILGGIKTLLAWVGISIMRN